MAEIDKALPNIKKSTIELPDQDKITESIAQQINQEQKAPDNIEIIQTEDIHDSKLIFCPSFEQMLKGDVTLAKDITTDTINDAINDYFNQ